MSRINNKIYYKNLFESVINIIIKLYHYINGNIKVYCRITCIYNLRLYYYKIYLKKKDKKKIINIVYIHYI